LRESNTFLYFNRHFKSKGIPVPEVIAVHDSGKCYLQQTLTLLTRTQTCSH
jgi:hypothetical protein